MVCVPCFIIPALIFLWHRFIQPYVLRWWNPWAVKDEHGNSTTEFPFECKGGVCPFGKKPDEAKEPLVTEPAEPDDPDVASIASGDTKRIKAE